MKCLAGSRSGKNHLLFVKAYGGALSKKSIVIHPRGHKMRKKAPRPGRKRSAPGVINPVETARRAARLVWPMARTRIIQPPFNHSARGINSKGLALISFRARGHSTISEVRPMAGEKSTDESENGIPKIFWPFDAATKATRREFHLCYNRCQQIAVSECAIVIYPTVEKLYRVHIFSKIKQRYVWFFKLHSDRNDDHEGDKERHMSLHEFLFF